MDIKTRLNRCCGKPVGSYICSEGIRCPECFDKLEGWREIEELNERVETLRQVVRDQTAHGVEQMKEIDRLREALKPFAKIADDYETLHDEDYVSVHRHDIELRHFRAIRSALQQKESE